MESKETFLKSVKTKLPRLLKVMNQRGPFYVPGDEAGLGIDGSMFPSQMFNLATLLDINKTSIIFDFGCNNGYSSFILSLFDPLAILAMDVKRNQVYQAMVSHLRLARTDTRPKRISFIGGDANGCSKTFNPTTVCKLPCKKVCFICYSIKI